MKSRFLLDLAIVGLLAWIALRKVQQNFNTNVGDITTRINDMGTGLDEMSALMGDVKANTSLLRPILSALQSADGAAAAPDNNVWMDGSGGIWQGNTRIGSSQPVWP